MDEITLALSEFQITLLNIALDDFEEPYTREERYEILVALMGRITDLVDDVSGGADVQQAYRRFRLALTVRDAFS